jgi:ketosteroid isomerase-like protein
MPGNQTAAAEIVSPLDNYYRALDAGELEATLACFTDDAVYIRPRLDGPGLEFVSGRGELAAFFRERGKKPYRHVVLAQAAEGGRCFVEGIAGVEGESPTHAFLVAATIEADGRISRYFALMAEASPDWS